MEEEKKCEYCDFIEVESRNYIPKKEFCDNEGLELDMHMVKASDSYYVIEATGPLPDEVQIAAEIKYCPMCGRKL